MSKFLKTMAVISALAILSAGLTSCKNNSDDDDSSSGATNTGFEGKFWNVKVINKLKTNAAEDEDPYALSSVTEIIFNKDGTGTYKTVLKEYYEGNEKTNHTETFSYTRSGSKLKFIINGSEEEFTIVSDNKICYGEIDYYRDDDITEVYAYVNTDKTNKEVTCKAIFLKTKKKCFMKKIVSTFYSFTKEGALETKEQAGTYIKSDSSITFTITGQESTGSLSENDNIIDLTYEGDIYYKL